MKGGSTAGGGWKKARTGYMKSIHVQSVLKMLKLKVWGEAYVEVASVEAASVEVASGQKPVWKWQVGSSKFGSSKWAAASGQQHPGLHSKHAAACRLAQ